MMSAGGSRSSPTGSGIHGGGHHFGAGSTTTTTAGKNSMDGVAAIRYYLDCMLEMDKTHGMKAFLLDAATTQIVSAVYSQTEILNKQVYLVSRLDKKQQPNSSSSSSGSDNNNSNSNSNGHLKALCFCRPTSANIELLCRELERPRFCEYHLFFSGILTSGWLRLLAEADASSSSSSSSSMQQALPRVVQVQELYADFLPLNSDFWSLQSRNTLPMTVAAGTSWAPKYAMQYERNLQGLQSMLLALKRQPAMIRYAGSSPCAEELARDLHDAILNDEIFHFRGRQRPSSSMIGSGGGSSSNVNGGLLLLVLDRRDDPVTPLLSQWTYQAMVHELLGLNNHRVILRGAPGVSSATQEDLQEVVLSSSADAFFAQHKHDNFGQLGEAIQKLLQDYQRTTAQHANVANLNSLQEMQAFLDKFPEVKSQSHIVSKHVAIMGELARLVEVCSLLDVSQFEQELACETGLLVGAGGAASKHDAHWRELMQKLESPAVKVPDKLRLGLLYALRYETTGNLHMVQSAMSKNGVPAEMVQFIPLLLRYGGQKSRGPGLYSGGILSGESSNMLSKMTKSFMTSVQGIDNVYAQHVPLVMDTIQAVLKGKLSSKTHPFVYDAHAASSSNASLRRSGSGNGSSHGVSSSSGSSSEGVIPQEILVFMVGGITYEEGTKVYELNETLKPRGIQIVLAGSTVHNSTSFLDELKTTAL
jgi:vacuolar protein sorting-associated protein 45